MSDLSEKEKMLRGKKYNSFDEELVKDRERAKKLCHKYNMTSPEEGQKRNEILQKLLKTDKDPWIEPNFYCDFGYNINPGKNFFANHNCVMLDCNEINFGENVKLGPNVQIYTVTHPENSKERNENLELAKPVKIERNVWIGGNTTITPGPEIGKNSIIGAGSVVTKNIPPNTVAAGNPCKPIRKLEK